MDNYPEPNVLPRAAGDEQTAKVLSKILPVLLEQAEYEQVYLSLIHISTSHRCGLAMPAPCRAPLIWEPRIKEDDKMQSGCRWVYTCLLYTSGILIDS